MFFDFDLTVPANTSKDNPVTLVCPVILGTITQAVVFIPPGSNGLAHLKIQWGLRQLFPSNEEGDFSQAGIALAWPENISLDAEPAELRMVGWNDDDTFDHTLHFSVAMQPASSTPSIASVVAALQTQAAPTPPNVP